MKTLLTLSFVVLGAMIATSQENESPQYQGENFSLEGALEMFKKANSLEEFEKLINQENNQVNNLDLNNDGKTDYIVVQDIQEKDSHLIVLSTYLEASEKQDIATISIEKTGESQASLQMEGNENLYATNTFIEPTDEKETIKTTKGGPNTPLIKIKTIVVNVWLWPSVRFLYAPDYVVWISPYRWHIYPRWWRPWRPVSHKVFYTRCAPHRYYCKPVANRKFIAARGHYVPAKKSSFTTVKKLRRTSIAHPHKNSKTKGIKTKKTVSHRRNR